MTKKKIIKIFLFIKKRCCNQKDKELVCEGIISRENLNSFENLVIDDKLYGEIIKNGSLFYIFKF